MSAKSLSFPLLLTLLSSSFSKDSPLPILNFSHFGPCVLKLVRYTDTLAHTDLTEHLIHTNNPTNLIYAVYGRPAFIQPWIHDKRNVLDFKFYEVCTVTIIVNFGLSDDKYRRYYFSYTRDAQRDPKNTVFIFISKLPPQEVIRIVDYALPRRIFVVHLKTNISRQQDVTWFYICPYCKNVFHQIKYTDKVKTLTITKLRAHWRTDITIAAAPLDRFVGGVACGMGQYYISVKMIYCEIRERQVFTVGNIVNVTFTPARPWISHWYGFYHQEVNKNHFDYYDTGILYGFRYRGLNLVYCNFNVWSEISELSVWVSPFTREVWWHCVAIFFVARCVNGFKYVGQIRGNLFDCLKAVGEVVFAIFATFMRQSASCTALSNVTFVSLVFTSFMLLAQYELFITGNLLAPPRPEVFRTLGEVFKNGYTLVYGSEEDDPNIFPVRVQLEDEFEMKSLGNFIHDQTLVIR